MKKTFRLAALVLCADFAVFPLFSQTKNTAQKQKKNSAGKTDRNIEKAENTVVFNEDFEKGEELFSLNRPEEAIPYFEKAIEAENVNPSVYIYLGVAYYQTGDYNKSLAVCVKGLAKENTDHKVLAYNAGNSCYAMGNYLKADASYAIAIKEDEKYSPAVLNRANAQLKLDHLEDSKNSYIKFLELDPESEQRERIELLISLLEKEIELRAKQKPELINPDDFVENEKMEVGEAPELVLLEIPVYEEEKSESPEKVLFEDSVAPEIPLEQLEIAESNEVLADESAPELPVEVSVVEEIASEKIGEKAPELPVAAVAAVEEIASEKIGDKAPELPVVSELPEKAKETDSSEKILRPEGEIPADVLHDEEPVPAEKIDGKTIAVSDYEKEAREAERLAKEKLELEKAQKEKAELERQKLLKQIEKEESAASTIKLSDDDFEIKAEEVPKKVEVQENSDGTVDIKIPTLSFRSNSYELSATASNEETIRKVYEILSDKAYSSFNVLITGYVNPDGAVWTDAEKKLALNRAETVKSKLVKMGLDGSRIEAANGDGKSDNKEYNRRVEFLLTKRADSSKNAK